MKIVKGIARIKTPPKWPVMTIGNFDGVHRGHQDVIARVVARAREKGGTAVVMIFDPHPRTFFNPDVPQRVITTLEQRVELIEKLGVDLLIVQDFDKSFAAIEAESFVVDSLVKRLGIRELFISSKFRFGHRAAGDIELLRRLAPAHHFVIHPVENLTFRHTVISSSFIRESILEGEMEMARLMLGRPFAIYGEVYPDTQRGTNLLRTPTSNVRPEIDLVPAHGIYAGIALLEGRRMPAAVYIGTRPTFNGDHVVIEVHILGFNGSLYGARMGVELIFKTRDDHKFTHLHELLSQIQQDVIDVRDYLKDNDSDPMIGHLEWGSDSSGDNR